MGHAYDISQGKAEDLRAELKKDIGTLDDKEGLGATTEPLFNTVVLLDDFAASGTSYLRKRNGQWGGKIEKILRALEETQNLGDIVAPRGVKVIIIIYVAADQALNHLQPLIEEVGFSRGDVTLKTVHQLGQQCRLCENEPDDSQILSLVSNDAYFDPSVDDEHAMVGGRSFRFGYADCRLPVVLSHNTPNNSIFLLWAEEYHNIRSLFPRVSRHRRYE